MGELSIQNECGLTVTFCPNGKIESVSVPSCRVSLKRAYPNGQFGSNIYLRKRDSQISYHPLMGTDSSNGFSLSSNKFSIFGSWEGLEFVCTIQLSPVSKSWRFVVDVYNSEEHDSEIDLVYVQDVGLWKKNTSFQNEYYISQYIDRRILADQQYGAVVCCRQNLEVSSANPWMILACGNSAASASVDGMQLYGNAYRVSRVPAGLIAPRMGGELAGELAIVALQESPIRLSFGETSRSTFVASVDDDHPRATSPADLGRLHGLINEFRCEPGFSHAEHQSFCNPPLFAADRVLHVDNLTRDELRNHFRTDWRHAEELDGNLLSFFYSKARHVVLRRKEALVDRPHASILRGQSGLLPDDRIMSTTCFMYGQFCSHLSQGNTEFNRLLSVCTSQFDLEPFLGLRVFLRRNGQWLLLGVPSAFEIGPNHCRWIYRHRTGCISVRTWASVVGNQINVALDVLEGGAVSLLVTMHFDESNNWQATWISGKAEIVLRPNRHSRLATIYPNAAYRLQLKKDNELLHAEHYLSKSVDFAFEDPSFLVCRVDEVRTLCCSISGDVMGAFEGKFASSSYRQFLIDCDSSESAMWSHCANISLQYDHADVQALQEVVPWFVSNALTHYLSPHGIEQPNGAAWGTRDVMQGPLEFLLATGHFREARKLICIVFSNQTMKGDWPQWWMFDRYATVRSTQAHADIPVWCLLAVCRYIEASNDTTLLDETLPYSCVKNEGTRKSGTLREHIDHLIDLIEQSFVGESSLIAYGSGDWNDAMQPANSDLADQLISTWTVQLSYQALKAYEMVCRRTKCADSTARLQHLCRQIRTDFNQYLVLDDTVSGYGLLEDTNDIRVLCHPSDKAIKARYRLLPIIQGVISEIFTRDQAHHHLSLADDHLLGPDGARLFDEPLQYSGGEQLFFRRAETSAYFGREAGCMYIHAHLRFADAQARVGNAEALTKALRQANPVAYRDIVACGDYRQANCYFSSSDVTLEHRYIANKQYSRIMSGKEILRSGWRIYSSGPGIYIALIIRRFVGIRDSFGKTIIDPVVPKSLNNFTASLDYHGKRISICVKTTKGVAGPRRIQINGKSVQFEREDNPYRQGGAVLSKSHFRSLLSDVDNLIVVHL